jgi:hypothetical protein
MYRMQHRVQARERALGNVQDGEYRFCHLSAAGDGYFQWR